MSENEIDTILQTIDQSWHVAAVKLRAEFDRLRQRVAELEAELAALKAGGEPEGWQLVPKAPTIDMLESARDCEAAEWGEVAISYSLSKGWPLMLAAAPKYGEKTIGLPAPAK